MMIFSQASAQAARCQVDWQLAPFLKGFCEAICDLLGEGNHSFTVRSSKFHFISFMKIISIYLNKYGYVSIYKWNCNSHEFRELLTRDTGYLSPSIGNTLQQFKSLLWHRWPMKCLLIYQRWLSIAMLNYHGYPIGIIVFFLYLSQLN